MADITIIVPVFNAARTLDACLDSLERQDLSTRTREIIVVDNNSTDATAAIARRHAAVRLFAEPRQSAYAARNHGLAQARGRWIVFTDGDCVPRADWLRRLTSPLDDPSVQVVMGRDRPAGTTTAVRLLGEYDHRKELFVLRSRDPAVYYGHTNNMAARRDAFDAVGMFDEGARGSDVIFVHRVLARWGVDAVRYQPDAVVDHLEIDRAAVYFRKAWLYGRSARRYSAIVPARPLRNAERLRIFRDTVDASGLSRGEAAYLLVLLVAGVACYYGGWFLAAPRAPWRARWRRKDGSDA
jgi:glycosyltransferase involved in cell wall biosynthesis